MTRTILILTSRTGGGHVSIAEALRDRLSDDASARIEIVDPQSAFFHWHYRMVSRYALWLWSAEFQALDTPARALFAHRLFTLLVARSLRKTIQRIQPDLIITTYPFLTYEVIQALKRTGDIPFVMLFSDPNGVHASWLTEKNAALTLAPTRETYAQALSVGFAPERLQQIGWPVRLQFSRLATPDPTRKEAMLKQLGLDPQRLTVFLQGGGEGAAGIGQSVRQLLQENPQLQIILATGTNQALQASFQHVPNVYPLPFTREIAPYMAAADIVMGKAGPNMLFEAVTLGKPFIATAYIPGQEEANLEFIQRYKLGWVALTLEQQQQLLAQLSAQPTALRAMDATVTTYQQWNQAQSERIVPLLTELLKQQQGANVSAENQAGHAR